MQQPVNNKPAASAWERPADQIKPNFKEYKVSNKVLETIDFSVAKETEPTKPIAAKPAKKNLGEHANYFVDLAGTEADAKPFLAVFEELKDKKKAETKMDEILKKFVNLVGKVEISIDEKETFIVRRLIEQTEPTLKLLKDANPTSNDFSKSKNKRAQGQSGRGGFSDRDKYQNKGGYNNRDGGDRRGGFNRDERPPTDAEWRVEEDEMV